MTVTINQCRAGRALLGWSLADLAAAAGVGIMTVNRFESGQAVRATSIEKICAALTHAGVTLLAEGEHSPIGGEGARLRPISRS